MYNLFCSIRKEDVEIAVDCWSRFFGADSGFGMETPYGICVNDMVASDHERIMGLKDALKELGVKNLPEDPPDFSKVVEIFRGLSPESKIYDIAYGLLKFQEYKGKDETELYNYCLNCLKQADLFGPMQFLSDAYIYNHEKRNDT